MRKFEAECIPDTLGSLEIDRKDGWRTLRKTNLVQKSFEIGNSRTSLHKLTYSIEISCAGKPETIQNSALMRELTPDIDLTVRH